MTYNFLKNEICCYLGIKETIENQVICIIYEQGHQLDIIFNEVNFVKLVISKKCYNHVADNIFITFKNKNLPPKEGDCFIYTITEDNTVVIWTKVTTEGLTLTHLLDIAQSLSIELQKTFDVKEYATTE